MSAVMILSESEKGKLFFLEVLKTLHVSHPVIARDSREAENFVKEGTVDCCLWAPNGFSEEKEKWLYHLLSQNLPEIFVLLPSSLYDILKERWTDPSIFLFSLPVNRTEFCASLSSLMKMNLRLKQLSDEKQLLLDKIADLKIIGRAKCVLIEYLKMTEKEAHRYIEKQAMDLRLSKRTAAENILKTYEP